MRETIFQSYIAARRMGKPPRPMLFLGPSGVGKTASVRHAARAIAEATGEVFVDYGEFSRMPDAAREEFLRKADSMGRRPFFFVDVLLLSHEPSDFSGIPREDVMAGARVTRFVPMEWAALLTRYPGIVFLDEITNVTRDDIRGVAYKLVDEKRAGSIVLSPEVKIVAAGNRPDDSSVAIPLPAPLLNRMAVYHVGPPSADSWYRYAAKKWPGADPFLLGYLAKLAAKPEVPEAPETLRQFATPRSCECLLEEEMEYRLGLGHTLTADEMRMKAVSWLGAKEGELLASWWARRSEILSFLSSGKEGESLSPAALWAIGVLAGRTVDALSASCQDGPAGADNVLKHNLGRAVAGIVRHGKEYAVPVFLGMNAFARGTDPRASAGKTLYVLKRISGASHRDAEWAFHAFDRATPQEYFEGVLENELGRAAEESGCPEAAAFASVAERLLCDQRVEVLRALERIERMKQPLADIVGESFADSITGFDSLANWERLAEKVSGHRAEAVVDNLVSRAQAVRCHRAGLA